MSPVYWREYCQSMETGGVKEKILSARFLGLTKLVVGYLRPLAHFVNCYFIQYYRSNARATSAKGLGKGHPITFIIRPTAPIRAAPVRSMPGRLDSAFLNNQLFPETSSHPHWELRLQYPVQSM